MDPATLERTFIEFGRRELRRRWRKRKGTKSK
jgi:hypothetical protein